MPISSKEVNREIRDRVRPFLRDQAFTKFNSRNAWRFGPDTIEVINFQSFNSNLAMRLHCTTFSFAINLGVYYLAVHRTPWASRYPVLYPSAPLAPPEFGCHARLHLKKSLTQVEYPRDDIWYVRPDGSNISEVVEDALRVITKEGLPWLAKYADRAFALSEYLKPRTRDGVEYVCAAGTLKAAEEGSAVALELGDISSAARLWEAITKSEYYARYPETITMAKEILSILGGQQNRSRTSCNR